jgi:hypothetical protein
MNLNKLLPKSSKQSAENDVDDLLYIILVVWGWDYETFKNTPIPIILRVLRAYNKMKRAEAKAHKKKK